MVTALFTYLALGVAGVVLLAFVTFICLFAYDLWRGLNDGE